MDPSDLPFPFRLTGERRYPDSYAYCTGFRRGDDGRRMTDDGLIRVRLTDDG